MVGRRTAAPGWWCEDPLVRERQRPPYLHELRIYLEERLDDATAVVAALAALLSDPEAYGGAKGEPGDAVLDYVHELLLTDRALRGHLGSPDNPVNPELFGGRWGAVWRDARAPMAPAGSYEYAVCISFAGTDRPIAERIAQILRTGQIPREVFYDEFEEIKLWGQELFEYLHDVYARRSMFCVILFSHAYRQRAWTRHELRAAQTRTLEERESYVLPVAVDEGAVPAVFTTVGYWSFSPGDEARIAEATEQQINDWIGANYLSIDEMTELINRKRVAQAILEGFRKGIRAALTADDLLLAEALRAMALISACNNERLLPPVRALVDWVLFADGAVGDRFGRDDRFALFENAGVSRWIGPLGPLLYAESGWKDHLDEIMRREDREASEPDLDESAE